MKLNPIDKNEAARYMGVHGSLDETIISMFNHYELIVRQKMHPAYVYRMVSVIFDKNCVKLGKISVPLTGKSIFEHLRNCNRAIIMAATVSSEADKLIRFTSVTDMTAAFVVDCLCSAAIEQICNRVENKIFNEIQVPFHTLRFSPGYGDLSITLQKDLINALNATRRIGVTVTSSYLLVPTKSVTAIIGISDIKISRQKHVCKTCTMNNRCKFKQIGNCNG